MPLTLMELMIWRGGKDSDTHEITSPTRIVFNTIQGKYRDLGEQITVWKRGPDPGVLGAGEGVLPEEAHGFAKP